MKKQESSRSPYKKMTTKKRTVQPKKKREPARSVKSPASNKRSTQTEKEKKRSISPPQLLILILLFVIVLILTVLIYVFFQPDKVQLWQEQLIPAVKESTELPLVKRLLPKEETLQITESPAVEQVVEKPEKPVEEESVPLKSKTRDARLFYVKVNTEGQITLKSIIRPVEYNMSPLKETINSLLEGPASDEINKGSLTLIPDGTRLLSARVEGNTAYLNFNEAFRFNSLGREGYTAQLKQIVYTATEFSNIEFVQIMIDGSIKDFLGGEGIYVGEPLSRETFQSVP